MRSSWLVVVLVLVCVRIALADSLDNAIAAYDRGDYATALPIFRSYATDGNAVAQYNLGVMYFNGHGVTQNYAEAARWYRKAADQGDAKAQYNLGLMYPRAKRSQTHRIQKSLKDMGYDPGPVDGIMGKKTRAAIQQFQRDKGLPAHGEPDDATLKAMNLK